MINLPIIYETTKNKNSQNTIAEKNDFSVFLIEEYINVNIYPFMLQNFIYKPKTQKLYKQKKPIKYCNSSA